MLAESVIQDFQEKVAAQVRLLPEGLGRYRVFTPFRFDDGDHLAIVLKRESLGWTLSDEGHTYMRLTYDGDAADLLTGTRQQILADTLGMFQVSDRDGELALPVPEGRYGDALFSFIQALVKIADISYLSREYIRSTFHDDFENLLSEIIPEERRSFYWHDPERDLSGKYKVDCRINGMPEPIFAYGLLNDTDTRDATIALHQFAEWGILCHPIAIFHEQEAIGRNVLARFSDVCGQQFPSLAGSQERITRFLQERLSG